MPAKQKIILTDRDVRREYPSPAHGSVFSIVESRSRSRRASARSSRPPAVRSEFPTGSPPTARPKNPQPPRHPAANKTPAIAHPAAKFADSPMEDSLSTRAGVVSTALRDPPRVADQSWL